MSVRRKAAVVIALVTPNWLLPAVPALAAGSVLPTDLSPWGMFMAADIVVKAVMIGLAIASVATWTIWLAKSIELASERRRVRAALAHVSRATSIATALPPAQSRMGAAQELLEATAEEVAISARAVARSGGEGLKERIVSRLGRIEAAEGRRMLRGTGVLATVGSTAPFVGLFGTVWGIMNSFVSIAAAQTTNLAVVAPGIAEALLATAMGLAAAIPAVIAYNAFARSIAGYRLLLAEVSAAALRLVSRQLDEGNVPVDTVASRAAA